MRTLVGWVEPTLVNCLQHIGISKRQTHNSPQLRKDKQNTATSPNPSLVRRGMVIDEPKKVAYRGRGILASIFGDYRVREDAPTEVSNISIYDMNTRETSTIG